MEPTTHDLGSEAAGIAALADSTRRALYEYVAGQPEPVGRDRAAADLDLPRHTVSFHLDRLVDDGLLQTEFRRLSGRTGPGAGRPSKLYRRADREFAISLPPRSYHVVGAILADAVDRAATGVPLPDALQASAREEGLSAAASTPSRRGRPLTRLARALTALGYEPRAERGEVALANCPFHALAQEHTQLVCGLNRSYVQGLADGLGCDGVTAHLEPEPGLCCVKARLD